MNALRRQLIVVVLVSAVAEVVLLRFALRLGPVLPTQVNVLPAFAVVEWLGVVALNTGVLAGGTLIGLVAWEALRSGPSRAPLAFTLLGAILVNLGLQPLVGVLPGGLAGLLHGVMTGSAVLLAVLGSSQPPLVRSLLVLVGLAQLLALAQAASQNANWFGGVGAVGGRPILAAETVAIVVALALPWLLQVRPRRGEILIGAAVGLGIAAAATVQPWGLATMAIWTIAFSLFLPPMLYGAAVMSVLVTVLALRHQSGGGQLIVGLTLVCLAGLKLDVSSYALMALTGLVIASHAAETLPMGAGKRGSSAIEWSVAGLRGSSL
jgi:hypothetical protein